MTHGPPGRNHRAGITLFELIERFGDDTSAEAILAWKKLGACLL